MYKINIVCVGGLKEKFFCDAQEEYIKRLRKFCDVTVTELAEQKLPMSPSEKDVQTALDKEAKQVEKYLKGKIFVCAVEGKECSSEDFCKKIFSQFNFFDTITFVIGSSYGLSAEVKKLGECISFSKMTFPHHLMRILLEEQIYRAFTIQGNITYHK